MSVVFSSSLFSNIKTSLLISTHEHHIVMCSQLNWQKEENKMASWQLNFHETIDDLESSWCLYIETSSSGCGCRVWSVTRVRPLVATSRFIGFNEGERVNKRSQTANYSVSFLFPEQNSALCLEPVDTNPQACCYLEGCWLLMELSKWTLMML